MTSRHAMGESAEMAKDAGLPAVIGFSLGYLGGKGKLDHGSVPVDAAAGAAVMAGTIFTPFLAGQRDTLRSIAGIAIGVGMARVGERYSKTGSLHGDGEWSIPGNFGEDPLVAASRNL